MDFSFFDIAILLLALGIFLYYYGTSTYDYWKKQGVPYVEPKFPFVGSSIPFSNKSSEKIQQDLYNQFKGCRFVGTFGLRKPNLFVRDPELLESILIKDFSHFYNRGTKTDPKLDPLSQHLVNLEDTQWKSLRNKLTPVFSSGKLKTMHQQLIDCSDLLLTFMDKVLKKPGPVEIREIMTKFTSDVIGSCAFGINLNVLDDPNSEFTKHGAKVFEAGFFRILRQIVRIAYPGLLRILKWKSYPRETENFFTSLISNTIQMRESGNVQRHDFLQLLINLRKQEKEASGETPNSQDVHFDDVTLTATAFVFFIAGFETTASTLSFILYELSINEDVQEKLYGEVREVLKKHSGEVPVEAVKEMKYMSQVISETLRLHPPVIAVTRVVSIPYKIPGTNIMLPKGLRVGIPIYSLHHDPENFPEPEKFDPGRFSEERKHLIKNCSYLPFGDGPRICIGMRFAQNEIKVALAKMLMKYKFKLNCKTPVPLKYVPHGIVLASVDGIWLDVEKRSVID